MVKIRNKRALGKTQLRKDALEILEAGLKSVETKHVMESQVIREDGHLMIGGTQIDLRPFKRIFVIGIGKAAFEAAKVLDKLLGDKITYGVVLDIQGGKLQHMKSVVGTHPLPSKKNIDATGDIMHLLSDTNKDDLVLTVISGGGSALLCYPFDLACDEMIKLTQELLRSGASIDEINTIRKHTSSVQGGNLASLAAPARVVSMIFSDVPGDGMSFVASGPTVLDETTIDDAKAIIKKYELLELCKKMDCNLRETPKDPKVFKHVTNILLISNMVATRAMRDKAKELGYKARIKSNKQQGEAKKIGANLCKKIKPGEAIIIGGETTVTVKGNGKGGRNQEVALGALSSIDEHSLVLSCASDGIDNTEAAGAIADNVTRKKAEKKNLDPETHLKANDSYNFFKKAGGEIITGPTGLNVSDLMLVMREK